MSSIFKIKIDQLFMNNYNVGIELTMEFEVLPEHSAAHLGSGTVSVLSTPSMILFMEIVARDLMESVLNEPYSTVGTHLDIAHKKAIAIGKKVKAKAVLADIDRKKLTFDVSVTYGGEVLGEGKHTRFIIDQNRFLENILS